MSDEQTIYISPEDDLTTVRERLEQIPTRRVTLVIPSQTQLRSHVAWKLLYARARELNKEVLIVSSDPQVRSVAHAVKFQVAHSLESPQPSKSRPTSRPTRSGASAGGRGRTVPPSSSSRALPRGASSGRARQSGLTSNQWYPEATERPESHFSGASSGGEEAATGGSAHEPLSSFDASEKQYNQPYDFRIDNSSHIRPLSPDQIEEPDLLLEDYTQAQDIRQAATGSMKAIEPPKLEASGATQPIEEPVPPYRVLPLPNISDDPFEYMQDSQPPPVAEQHGAVSIEGFDTSEHTIQDVADAPMELVDDTIEYRGDRDAAVPPLRSSPSTRSWVEPSSTPDDEPEEDGPRRAHGVRPRRSRSSYLPPSLPAQPALGDDDLPQVTERPTQIRPPTPSAQPPAARSAPLEPSFTPAPVRPPAQTRPGPAAAARRQPVSTGLSQPAKRVGQGAAAASPRRTGSTASTTSRRPVPQKPQKPKRSARSIFIITALIIVVLLLAFLVYAIPSANVTLTVAARNYTHAVSLTASANKQSNTLPARTFSKNFSKSGNEPATGSKTVDTATASGYVCISNSGSNAVDIPSQINVATSGSNVQFLTQVDTVVPAGYTCDATAALQIKVTAVMAGETGNVPANSINVLPDASLNTIAQYNNVAVSTLKLTVSNALATSGGGVQPVKAIAATDLTHAKTDLHKQLQASIEAWTKQLSTQGVVGQPVTTDTLVNAPQVNATASSGSFAATVMVHATVLLVNMHDIQQGAKAQLNTLIHTDKHYTNYVVSQDTAVSVKMAQLQTQSLSATSVMLKFNATGKAIPDLSVTTVQHLVAGQSPAQARATLLTMNVAGVHVQKVDIALVPAIMPWITNSPANIHVLILPGSTAS